MIRSATNVGTGHCIASAQDVTQIPYAGTGHFVASTSDDRGTLPAGTRTVLLPRSPLPCSAYISTADMP
eukprot:1910025-Rhodomonas_salina.1